jgi:hypothetical protein
VAHQLLVLIQILTDMAEMAEEDKSVILELS